MQSNTNSKRSGGKKNGRARKAEAPSVASCSTSEPVLESQPRLSSWADESFPALTTDPKPQTKTVWGKPVQPRSAALDQVEFVTHGAKPKKLIVSTQDSEGEEVSLFDLQVEVNRQPKETNTAEPVLIGYMSAVIEEAPAVEEAPKRQVMRYPLQPSLKFEEFIRFSPNGTFSSKELDSVGLTVVSSRAYYKQNTHLQIVGGLFHSQTKRLIFSGFGVNTVIQAQEVVETCLASDEDQIYCREVRDKLEPGFAVQEEVSHMVPYYNNGYSLYYVYIAGETRGRDFFMMFDSSPRILATIRYGGVHWADVRPGDTDVKKVLSSLGFPTPEALFRLSEYQSFTLELRLCSNSLAYTSDENFGEFSLLVYPCSHPLLQEYFQRFPEFDGQGSDDGGIYRLSPLTNEQATERLSKDQDVLLINGGPYYLYLGVPTHEGRFLLRSPRSYRRNLIRGTEPDIDLAFASIICRVRSLMKRGTTTYPQAFQRSQQLLKLCSSRHSGAPTKYESYMEKLVDMVYQQFGEQVQGKRQVDKFVTRVLRSGGLGGNPGMKKIREAVESCALTWFNFENVLYDVKQEPVE